MCRDPWKWGNGRNLRATQRFQTFTVQGHDARATLSQQIVDMVRDYGEQTDATAATRSADIGRLFATLDKARNVTPIGSLRREQLYDRAVLR
jgi:hypothetical protein